MNILLIMCLITTVLSSETHSVHRVFVSRKSRSNSAPIESGFMYNQVNSNPGTISMFGSDRTTNEPVLENYSSLKTYLSPIQYHPIDFSKQIYYPYESSLSKRDLDFAKAESKHNSNFLPSKIKSDIKYEKLKSAMQYQPEVMNEMISRYDSNEYHMDDDDVRSGSKGVYDNWPYYHHQPYEYDHLKIDAEVEKAKDKRYAVDAAKIIPIHEDLSHDIPNSHEPVFITTEYYTPATDDNPMTGHDPFFSFVLNDYYDKSLHDDHLTFKGLDWGKDFDFSKPIVDIDDYSARNRRLGNNYKSPNDHGTTNSNSHYSHTDLIAGVGDSVTEKVFDKKNTFDKHNKGETERMNDKTKYDQKEHQNTDFKNFVDSFANKFGAEDHRKDSNYILKRNQNNGESRKGFHRVYHKDEYQEDKEFFNNNNNSALAEEKGSSNAHIGGSEALLASHGSMSAGGKSNSFKKSGDTEKKRFENNHKGHEKTNGFDGHFNRYRDVAKKAAQSNDADYSDHYRI